jgi:hypothetical protein
MLDISRQIAKANGLADRIVPVRGDVRAVSLPEPVDLVVADQLGPSGIEGGLIEFYFDANARFLSSGGRLVPEQVTTHLAPAASAFVETRISKWMRPSGEISFAPIAEIAASTVQRVEPDDVMLLAAGQPCVSYALGVDPPRPRKGRNRFVVERSSGLTGLCAWFDARLVDDVFISNSPVASTRVRRPTAFLPLPASAPVNGGDIIDTSVTFHPVSGLVEWRVRITGSGRAATSYSQNNLATLTLDS